MKKADLIFCVDGNRVLKNIEGSSSTYYPSNREQVIEVNFRKATCSDINLGLKNLGIIIQYKANVKITKNILNQLPYYSETCLAFDDNNDLMYYEYL